LIADVGDEKVAGAVHGHAEGDVQTGAGREATVATKPRSAVPGHGGDGAGDSVYEADAVVIRVGDEEVASGVHGHAGGDGQIGVGRGVSVAAEALGAIASDRSDDPARGFHAADAVIPTVRDEDVARTV
jgi:hypothetical protein